ncbi:MAG TPA: Hsp20/alpha crystallin family protein [Planctomycetota bacterium]|nr:Hsp20/alpha crystallin family protein [Planctomycetota bacterium]
MFDFRGNEFHTIGRLRGEVDRLLSGFLEGLHGQNGDQDSAYPTGVFPPVNLWEDEGNFHAEAELPGIRMEDLDISVVGNELILKGSRKTVLKDDVHYHRRDRAEGAFAKVLRLPAAIQADKVQARMKDGVLTVTLPKAEAVKPKRIPVTLVSK